jgi:hypothetical protein
MKRFLLTIFTLLTIYVIYIDLTQGTLPEKSTEESAPAVETLANTTESLPAFEASVGRGETLISIVERHIDKPLPVSIEELVQDFQKLNPGQAPEKIQIGVTYLFPDYSKGF